MSNQSFPASSSFYRLSSEVAVRIRSNFNNTEDRDSQTTNARAFHALRRFVVIGGNSKEKLQEWNRGNQ